MNGREEQIFDTNYEQINPNNEDFYESDESIEEVLKSVVMKAVFNWNLMTKTKIKS
jgi:hypothetical protein